jgi:hypothetical protein
MSLYLKKLSIFALLVWVTTVGMSGKSSAQETVRTLSGSTRVEFASGLVSALNALKVTLKPVHPGIVTSGKKSGVEAHFPIITGVIDLDTAKGDFTHSGGLKLVADSMTVEITDFEINTANLSAAQLLGNVTVDGTYVGKLALFDLTLPEVTLPLTPKDGEVKIPDVQVTLTQAAASALNQAFSVSAFTAGLQIGIATVSIAD